MNDNNSMLGAALLFPWLGFIGIAILSTGGSGCRHPLPPIPSTTLSSPTLADLLQSNNNGSGDLTIDPGTPGDSGDVEILDCPSTTSTVTLGELDLTTTLEPGHITFSFNGMNEGHALTLKGKDGWEWRDGGYNGAVIHSGVGTRAPVIFVRDGKPSAWGTGWRVEMPTPVEMRAWKSVQEDATPERSE